MGESEHSQNEFSHDNIDMNANDQSKHQPEPEIGTENPNGPESEGTDGGDTSIMYQVTMLELMLFLVLMVQDQRKLWVAVSIPKMNLATRIMICIQMINTNKVPKQILVQITQRDQN
jgi:hypothetical protein